MERKVIKNIQAGKEIMQDKYYENLQALLDCLTEGILIIDAKNNTIVNDKFEELFNIKDGQASSICEVLEKYGLNEILKSEDNVEKILYLNHKKVKIERLKVDTSNESHFLLIIFKTVDKHKTTTGKMYCAKYSLEDIITQNEKMLELKSIVKKAAKSLSTVLIHGQSGTGKEYFAHAIHNASQRKNKPFIKINCAAIPHELLESELFGYESGAFTGSKKNGKIGKLELANEGTILLDEISSMPYSMQAKLLRVLEEREIERVGGSTSIKIDIRIISSTNEKLKNLINGGCFRQDLFYRLNVVRIDIPPLRDRLDDIPKLSENIQKQLIQNVGLPFKTVTAQAMLALKAYHWPGNVRELRNILERATNMSTNNHIDLHNLPDYINSRLQIDGGNKEKSVLKHKIAEVEIKAIIEALNLAKGNRTEAANQLGIHRTSLYKKIDNYGININTV